MTPKEFRTNLLKYKKMEKYYHKKVEKLKAEYFAEINKDNEFLKIYKEQTDATDN